MLLENDLPNEFWKCGEMFVQIKRERDSLQGVMQEIRNILQLTSGESVTEALKKLLNKREAYIKENLTVEKATSKSCSARESLMNKLAELNLYFNPKASTKDLQKKLDNFGTSEEARQLWNFSCKENLTNRI